MTPSKQELETKAKHFANTVFAIGAGFLMLAATLLQPHVLRWLGPDYGESITFIIASILILVLAAKRPRFALFAIDRQCKKYGHVLSDESSICSRCYQTILKSAD